MAIYKNTTGKQLLLKNLYLLDANGVVDLDEQTDLEDWYKLLLINKGWLAWVSETREPEKKKKTPSKKKASKRKKKTPEKVESVEVMEVEL